VNKVLIICVIAVFFSSNFVLDTALANGKPSRVSHIHIVTAKAAKPFAYEGMVVKAMPLPRSNKRPVINLGSQIRQPGAPGYSVGFSGTGVGNAQSLGLFSVLEASRTTEPTFTSLEHGTADLPFNTRRVDTNRRNNVSASRSYRAVGALVNGHRLFCSAALIKRGLIVTAAHCVAEFGASTIYSDWQFIPALFTNRAPFGVWGIQEAYVLDSYLDGTDACAVPGIVCANDIAILVASPQADRYPGDTAGWLGYGWNGAGFTASNLALISELGYSASHDQGTKMQQTDSQASVDVDLSNNTVFGSRQTGGSSGSPLIVNLGRLAELSEGVEVGMEGVRNMVVGVVSWGSLDQTVKLQGASPFTSENIVALVDAACADFPDACKPRRR